MLALGCRVRDVGVDVDMVGAGCARRENEEQQVKKQTIAHSSMGIIDARAAKQT